MAERPKTFGDLLREVVRARLCVYCGACVATCPVGVIAPVGEEPALKGACIACQLCYYQCPRTSGLVPFPMEEFEKAVFGRPRDSSGNEVLIGVHRSIYAARALDEELRSRCQDGGAATALLTQSLLSGAADGVVATGVDPSQPWKPSPRVFLDPKELREAAGTKYTLGPLITGLNSASFEFARQRIAIVGVPCEVQALRRMQSNPFARHKTTDTLGAIVGLFCMESYSYEKLLGHLREKGVDPSRINRFAIKRGRFRVYKGDKEAFSAPLRDFDPFTRDACGVCRDFTAELADVSVGGVGVPEGWSLVITRTELGEGLVQGAVKAGLLEANPLSGDSEGLRIVLRLAGQKRGRPTRTPRERFK